MPVNEAMEIEGGGSNPKEATLEKKYYIDTTSLHVTKKGMEVTTFLKDGMSKFIR